MTEEQAKKMQFSVFDNLNSVNVNDKTKDKGSLTYLSWSYAWGEVKKRYPDANYTIYKNEQGWNYHTDGRTCWVECSVTINGLEHIEHLAIMDSRNQAVPLDKVTSTLVVKTIQRCVTKCCARHGLGLYIYAGEDLPDDPKPEKKKTATGNEVTFGTASGPEQKQKDEPQPFDVGESVELQGLRALMEKDSITEAQVLDAFKGKFSAIENIDNKSIIGLLNKWEKFVAYTKGGK